MEVDFNWIAILAGAASAMVLGAVWYNNAVFGEKWRVAAGLSKESAGANEMKGMVASLVRSLVLSFVLYHVIYVTAYFYSQDSFFVNAISVGFAVGLGLIAFSMLLHDIFDQRDKVVTRIHVGFEIIAVLLVSGVIGIIGT